MAWDPKVYSAFAAPRLRPALDLMARIRAETPKTVADLGCGTGNVTRILRERWPEAAVTGVDSSPEMLKAAQAEGGGVTYVQGDMGTWAPPAPLDILFSNAAFHWLGGHERLFPRLMGLLAPGGTLAVQMPHNHYAASHALMTESALAGPWRSLLEPLAGNFPVSDPAIYYGLLAPLSASLDIWETEYLHVLDGDNPVVNWTMGTALRPLLAAIDHDREWHDGFLADYAARIRQAYPPQPDGRTLLPFRRLFMVATKH